MTGQGSAVGAVPWSARLQRLAASAGDAGLLRERPEFCCVLVLGFGSPLLASESGGQFTFLGSLVHVHNHFLTSQRNK